MHLRVSFALPFASARFLPRGLLTVSAILPVHALAALTPAGRLSEPETLMTTNLPRFRAAPPTTGGLDLDGNANLGLVAAATETSFTVEPALPARSRKPSVTK